MIYRFSYKKASNFRNFISQVNFSKSMDLQLFKTGLRMFLRPLVMILWPNKGFGKWAKKMWATKKNRHNYFSNWFKSEQYGCLCLQVVPTERNK